MGIAQSHFNVGSMRKTLLALPPILEQQEMVNQIRKLFHFFNEIEQSIFMATAHTEQLTQSILTKAFKGELVYI